MSGTSFSYIIDADNTRAIVEFMLTRLNKGARIVLCGVFYDRSYITYTDSIRLPREHFGL